MPSGDPESQSFLDEETFAQRREFRQHVLRWTLAFALLFAAVFFAFWWSGAALRFGAARVANASLPTYRVDGVVRNARTREPVPWAVVEDDPAGRPPFFRAEAGADGAYLLTTLAEPHRIRVTANGYQSRTIYVGKQWFVWWPRGEEQQDVLLAPE